MESIVIAEILTWQQAAVAIVIIIAVLVVPPVINYLQNRVIRHELKPNSGSSARDAIDRIEKKLNEHVDSETARTAGIVERLDKLEEG